MEARGGRGGFPSYPPPRILPIRYIGLGRASVGPPQITAAGELPLRRRSLEDTEGTLQEALELGESGDWEGMSLLLHAALEEDPDNAALLCWAAMAERELGREGSAYDLFRRTLAAAPDDPHLMAMAGNGIAAFDDPDAEGALRTAALMAPQLPAARLYYGAYLSREGMLDEALRELDAARELDPDDPAVALERGVALALKGDPGAQAEFERALGLDPEDGWIRVLLGLALLEFNPQGDEDAAAAEQLEAGARLRPDDLEAQLLASAALSLAGREDGAWEMLERARMAAGGDELPVLEAVEERLDAGEGMEELLRSTLLPVAWHDRLMVRP